MSQRIDFTDILDESIRRIDENLLHDVSSDPRDARYYLCGTPSLVHDATQRLIGLGAPQEHILQEQFRGYTRHAHLAA